MNIKISAVNFDYDFSETSDFQKRMKSLKCHKEKPLLHIININNILEPVETYKYF